ncbi:MAG TPA: Holliday junction resolvase RuvX [Candidatus Limnocylindrales bacterium]|nr:Holliday junction resolvase RuvX [Candidatus Limnocylindrales bacterium]
MSRLLGLDVGERRIGIALADRDGRAMPLTTLRRSDDPARDGAAVAALIATHDVAELIVGLPLDMRGTEGPQAARTRAWVDSIRPFVEAAVRYRDERLSSHLAEQRLGPMKRGRSGGPPTRDQRTAWRARVDREAAAIILQDELDARAEAGLQTQMETDR